MLTNEGIISTLVEGFPNSEPNLPYVYVQQIENPVLFAKKVNRVMNQVLSRSHAVRHPLLQVGRSK
ncbi:hypothetical protein [Chengkuizengella axinellae]|uniref:Uncharacterized protein n=1 Tax=Chengkuizengella axinellae TaxID=3064388 RepID=A0ABT9J044_9BACL|nr:hypothetical protein [Chengkuizengella sp. 2205SS18-9]MDP5274947.1 hypothetical protein [Chengkuizengella sp. 2205SS18-9]